MTDADKELRATLWIIDKCRQDYELSRNPLYAWRAYSECRAAGLSLPDWVWTYFDRVGDNFMELTLTSRKGLVPKEVAPAVAAALEMKKPGKSGRTNVFTEFDDMSGLNLAAELAEYLDDGHKPGMAAEYVAEAYGVSKSTVARAWERHGWFFSKK